VKAPSMWVSPLVPQVNWTPSAPPIIWSPNEAQPQASGPQSGIIILGGTLQTPFQPNYQFVQPVPSEPETYPGQVMQPVLPTPNYIAAPNPPISVVHSQAVVRVVAVVHTSEVSHPAHSAHRRAVRHHRHRALHSYQ
jgi:hypothetical protein